MVNDSGGSGVSLEEFPPPHDNNTMIKRKIKPNLILTNKDNLIFFIIFSQNISINITREKIAFCIKLGQFFLSKIKQIEEIRTMSYMERKPFQE